MLKFVQSITNEKELINGRLQSIYKQQDVLRKIDKKKTGFLPSISEDYRKLEKKQTYLFLQPDTNWNLFKSYLLFTKISRYRISCHFKINSINSRLDKVDNLIAHEEVLGKKAVSYTNKKPDVTRYKPLHYDKKPLSGKGKEEVSDEENNQRYSYLPRQ